MTTTIITTRATLHRFRFHQGHGMIQETLRLLLLCQSLVLMMVLVSMRLTVRCSRESFVMLILDTKLREGNCLA